MKNKKTLLIISLLLIPIIAYAKSEEFLSISTAIFMEAFVSIHMSVFVLGPLAKIFFEDNSKRAFWTMFVIRAIVLLFCDFFISTVIAMVDFFAVFVGAVLVVPICGIITKVYKKDATNLVTVPSQNTPTSTNLIVCLKCGAELNPANDYCPHCGTKLTKNIVSSNFIAQTNQVNGIELKCAKCNATLKVTDKFCSNCGAPFSDDNVVVTENAAAKIEVPVTTLTDPNKKIVKPTDFDSIYSGTNAQLLERFIQKEMEKAKIDPNSKLIPADILKRKKLLSKIFALLVFVYISLIFFHFPLGTYVLGLIILIIFFILSNKYNLMKYLKKEIESRPSEKISNIVRSVKNSFVEDEHPNTRFIYIAVAIILPLVIFINPHIMYEKTEGGYAVRFYTFGLTNYTTATIPKTYKGSPIVSLRGNTFSNMPFLEEVSLPNTITEIRGQAFKNCRQLSKVNIPSKLEYLGGGAFYNAKSIESIELPDTLTYLGGEAFYGASRLETIKLSNNLTEIRGDTFEYCSALKSITIPDKVTRIGGHAFYGATSLSSVIISEKSQLREIGSSAFRQCASLYSITLPDNTYYNERAFKESPTYIRRFSDPKDEYGNSNQDTEVTLEKVTLPYTSDYLLYTAAAKKQTLLFDNDLKLEYEIGDKVYRTVYIDGKLYNESRLSGKINIKVYLYDEDYNELGMSEEEIRLSGISIKYLFSSIANDKFIDTDPCYYKIEISELTQD